MQLQLDIYTQNSDLFLLQQQIDAQVEAVRKLRKKLFAELSTLKKSHSELHQENIKLKEIVYELANKKTDWIYRQNGCLFDVPANTGSGY